MATSILVTKLFIPPKRARLVNRPALLERLNSGLNRKLTLLSAPAGFGKTTLIGHWVDSPKMGRGSDGRPTRVAWLSLDEGDNYPVRFLNYFIAAINQAEGMERELGHGALNMLQSPQPPSVISIVISLINDLASFPGKIVLVLDDFHRVEAGSVHEAVLFLLENLPPQLRLVIATRQDPDWSLGRLRAQNQLTELRAADLRFTSSEACPDAYDRKANSIWRIANPAQGGRLALWDGTNVTCRTRASPVGCNKRASGDETTSRKESVMVQTGGKRNPQDMRCATCGIRRRAEATPDSIMARVWRWHTGWCPGWNGYQRALAETREVAVRPGPTDVNGA